MTSLKNGTWVFASIRGRSHLKDGKPNQDAFSFTSDATTGVYVAVISDGAGSSPYSNVGAKACTDYLVGRFLQIGCDLLNGKLEHRWVEQKILHAISEHVETLGSGGRQLKDYHHTLTAVIATATGGRLIQIGDSPALVTIHGGGLQGITERDLEQAFAKYEVITEVKTEYANETHFVTQPEWRNHIRISPLPKDYGAIFLMTDGAASAFLSREEIHRPSLFGAMSEILREPARANEILSDYLSHPALDEITADDKTVVCLLPSSWFDTSSHVALPALGEHPAPAAMPPPPPSWGRSDEPLFHMGGAHGSDLPTLHTAPEQRYEIQVPPPVDFPASSGMVTHAAPPLSGGPSTPPKPWPLWARGAGSIMLLVTGGLAVLGYVHIQQNPTPAQAGRKPAPSVIAGGDQQKTELSAPAAPPGPAPASATSPQSKDQSQPHSTTANATTATVDKVADKQPAPQTKKGNKKTKTSNPGTSTTSTGTGTGTGTGKPSDKRKVPQPEDKTKASQPEDKTKASLPEDKTKASLPEDKTKASQPEDKTKASQPEDKTKASLPEDKTKASLPEDKAKASLMFFPPFGG